MTAQEVCEHVAKNIVPQLQELGIEAFVLVGYAKDGDGKVTKINLALPGQNPAYQDGLRTIQMLADRWGQGQL